MDWNQFLLFAILGLGTGALIAGIALGIVLTYRGSGFINLATGAIAMLGGYSYWSLKTGEYGWYASTAAALVLTFLFLVALGAPSLSCGKYPTEPAACNDQAQFFQYQGKGVFTRLSGWLRPPSNFTPQG